MTWPSQFVVWQELSDDTCPMLARQERNTTCSSTAMFELWNLRNCHCSSFLAIIWSLLSLLKTLGWLGFCWTRGVLDGVVDTWAGRRVSQIVLLRKCSSCFSFLFSFFRITDRPKGPISLGPHNTQMIKFSPLCSNI